jgi:alpha-galactosidase
LSGERGFELTPTDEAFADVMAAVCGRGPLTTDVSVPNVGQVDGIERGAVVDTNAAIRAGEIRPLPSGGFPRSLRSLISTRVDTSRR